MKIAFYRAWNGTWLDKLISILTLSKYSHCEIIFSDGECASSSVRDGGIRFKYITMDEKWDVFPLNMFLNEELMFKWFWMNIDDTYDYLGALGALFGFDWSSDDKKYCSYACASVLNIRPIQTPGGLFKLLKSKNFI